MAAETAVLLTLARPGMTIALAAGAYSGTSVLMGSLEPWGLRFVEYDQTGPPPAAADIVWVEAPANPVLTEPDWEALGAHPGLVVCDATVSTPVYLRALRRGADVVVHSAAGFLTAGATMPCAEWWCTPENRGRAEAPARVSVRRHRRDRLAAGRRLAARRARLAHAPDGPDHRDGERARASPRGASRGRARPLSRLLRSDLLRRRRPAGGRDPGPGLVTNATSLGGVNSTIESRSRWEGDRIPPGLLRLSVGLEEVDELWADLAGALA